MNMVHQSSSERDSVGSRDTGIDLNPDDVPVGYRPAVSSHRRRSRSVTAQFFVYMYKYHGCCL